MARLSDSPTAPPLAPLSVRVPEEIKRGVAAIALRDGLSLTEVVGRALSEYLAAQSGRASQSDRLDALEGAVARLTAALMSDRAP